MQKLEGLCDLRKPLAILFGFAVGATVAIAVTALLFEAMLVNDRPHEMVPGVVVSVALAIVVFLACRNLTLAIYTALGGIVAGVGLPLVTAMITFP